MSLRMATDYQMFNKVGTPIPDEVVVLLLEQLNMVQGARYVTMDLAKTLIFTQLRNRIRNRSH